MSAYVYADVIFLINFIMDCFILWIVSRFSHKKTKCYWLLLGGLLMAGLYCLVIFTALYSVMRAITASVLILAIGVTVALHPTGLKSFLKMLLLSYLVSFTVGGLGMVLFFMTDLPWAVAHFFTQAGSVSWKLTAACVAIAYVLIKLGIHTIKRVTYQKQTVCPVTIAFGENAISIQALIDTGHTLRDPITQAPVIIAEFETIKAFLPDSLKLLFYEKQEGNLPGLIPVSAAEGFFKRIRLIPFTGIGRQNGLLIGFKPDSVSLHVHQKETTRDDIVVGIYNNVLSQSGQYQGLIGPEILSAF